MSRPGALDQRIAIKRETLTPGPMGGQTVALATAFTAWARVKPSTGTEQDRADRLVASASIIFTIRNHDGRTVREADRIEWQGIDYNVREVRTTGGRSMYLDIIAERGVAQ